MHTKVLDSIQGRDFVQYPFFMKSGINIKNPNKFCYFYHDYSHDIEEYHALKR